MKFKWPEHIFYPCRDSRHGDFQTDIAFKIAKHLGISPVEAAERIVDAYCTYNR